MRDLHYYSTSINAPQLKRQLQVVKMDPKHLLGTTFSRLQAAQVKSSYGGGNVAKCEVLLATSIGHEPHFQMDSSKVDTLQHYRPSSFQTALS
jgi:hypothetical protein